jgi:hypothetical protein
MSSDNYHNDRRFKPTQEQGNASLYLEKVNPKDTIAMPFQDLTDQGIGGRECSRCLLGTDYSKGGVIIDEDGECEMCRIHDMLERQSRPEDLEPAIYQIQKQGRGKQYNCILGISGGLDSSTLLYLAVRKWHLRPLVIHFDNGWNNEAAESNMKNLCEKLNINSITYRLNKEEYNNLNLAFLEAGLPDADIPNDIAMTKQMYDTADKYGIKWILNGHDFRTEGSTPAKWTYMDAKYIEDVYEKFTGLELEDYPLFTFWDQIKYALKGIKQIRPFHYMTEREQYENEMKAFTGWQDYGGKHCENIYTEFVGSHLLPLKHDINKTIVYLSAKVRSGTIPKSEAKLILSAKTLFDLNKLGDQKDKILSHTHGPIGDRKNYKRYNFRKWSYVVWLLAVLKVIPFTAWWKYCKKQN